jgi:hypothetical protein
MDAKDYQQGSSRLSLLRRKESESRAAFCAYWASQHAALAVKLPGLERYYQNQVVETLWSSRGDPIYAVDGLPELYFGPGANGSEKETEQVVNQLIQDEPKFMSGLTGLNVENFSHRQAAEKVIVMGAVHPGPLPAEARGDLDKLAAADLISVVRTWARPTLWSEPKPPASFAVLWFAERGAAKRAFGRESPKAFQRWLARFETAEAILVNEHRVVG